MTHLYNIINRATKIASVYKGILILLLVLITSCNKDLLNKTPLDRFSDDAVWKDASLVQTWINSTYRTMPQGHTSGAMMIASVSDESHYRTGRPDYIVGGNITSTTLGVLDFWTTGGEAGASYGYWKVITNCNIFFDKIDASRVEATLKSRMVGEMKFLRAYSYFKLVAFFGGVPLITKPFNLTDKLGVARNTYDECMNFVVAELAEAATLLPLEYSNTEKSKITKGAAMSARSRALLYMASPLNNPQNTIAKWQAAAAAAKAVIDLNKYSLFANYKDQFLQANSYNSESIWSRPFNYSVDPELTSGGVELTLYPNGYNGFAQSHPLQNLVDAYEMVSGKLPADDPTYNPQNPFVNRDPRFYASILYDGALFQGREVETFLKGGRDSNEGPVSANNATTTGYYYRKFINEAIVNPSATNQGNSPWIFIRYAEILLNYAEASFFLGDEATCRNYINQVRSRPKVTMPPVTESGAALLTRLQHERQIELAFEEHRYFDVRRWKIAPLTDNIPGRKMVIMKNVTTGVKTYTVSDFLPRAFAVKNYLVPIPQSEIDKNSLLVQNPGY
ncbi:MAG: RagB/SusD family nutrient uptake outer membrane protein [Chitinophagaceae bacterium]